MLRQVGPAELVIATSAQNCVPDSGACAVQHPRAPIRWEGVSVNDSRYTTIVAWSRTSTIGPMNKGLNVFLIALLRQPTESADIRWPGTWPISVLRRLF